MGARMGDCVVGDIFFADKSSDDRVCVPSVVLGCSVEALVFYPLRSLSNYRAIVECTNDIRGVGPCPGSVRLPGFYLTSEL